MGMMREGFSRKDLEGKGRYSYATGLQGRLTKERTRPANPFADFLPFGYDPKNIYSNFGEQFLTDNPEIAYLSSPTAEAFTREGITGRESTEVGGAMRGKTPSKEKFYQQSFQDIYQGYLGRLGQIARAGQMPSLSFTEHLRGDIDPTTGQQVQGTDPLSQRYSAMSPSERSYFGGSTQAYAPRTRQIYY